MRQKPVALRPSFAHPVGGHEMSDGVPLLGGRHHFFPSKSFRATSSSMASASPGALVLERPQPPGLGDIHAAETGLPLVDAGIADTVLAAQLRDRNAGLARISDIDTKCGIDIGRYEYINSEYISN